MPIETIDVGDRVNCDDCNKEWKPDDAGDGAILVGSKAYCPDCAPDMLSSLEHYGETQFINGRQPKGMTFHAWVMHIRGGDNTVTIRTGQDAIDALMRRK